MVSILYTRLAGWGLEIEVCFFIFFTSAYNGVLVTIDLEQIRKMYYRQKGTKCVFIQ